MRHIPKAKKNKVHPNGLSSLPYSHEFLCALSILEKYFLSKGWLLEALQQVLMCGDLNLYGKGQ